MPDRKGIALACVLSAVLGAAVLAGSDERDPAEQYRGLVAEYEAAKAGPARAFREAKTQEERRAAYANRLDPLPFAKKMVRLAEEHPEEPVELDALVWVVLHARRGSEERRALARIKERYVRDPRVGVICGSLFDSDRPMEGGELLRRIAEENPDRAVRAEACLRAAIREHVLKPQAAQLRGQPPADLARAVEDPESLAQLEALRDIPASRFDEESERWLGRVLEGGPEVLEGENVLNVCIFLSRSVLPNAGTALRHIKEKHPDPDVRALSCWCLADRAERMAAWATQLRWLPAAEADFLRAELGDPSVRALEAIDPKEQTDEANRLLREVAGQMKAVPFHERSRLGDRMFHMGYYDIESSHLEAMQPLLASILEAHPRPEVQSLTCRALAAHLAERADLIARLRPAAGADRASWVARLGADRFEAIRSLDPAAVNREAEIWLERAEGVPTQLPVRLDQDGEQVLGRLTSAVGKVGPEIEAKDPDGNVFKLSDYRGKVVLLSFWGTWCGPCLRMIPHEKALAEQFNDEAFAVVGVNNDQDRAELKKYLETEGISWRNWWCPGESIEPVLAAWRPASWPTAYLLDPEGVVRARFDGDTGFETLKTAVERVLNGQTP